MASLHSAQDIKSMTFSKTVGGQAIRYPHSGSNLKGRESLRVTSKQTVALRPATKGTLKLAKPGPEAAPKEKTSSVEHVGKLSTGKTRSILRTKQYDTKGTPKILTSIEQLKLLSKLEKAGLLSAVEKSGLTLSKIEKLGLLSTAEKLGLLSAAGDRNTPGAVYTLAFVLFALGPAVVFFLPDTSPTLVYTQYALAAVAALGGAAAFGGATFLSNLQK